MNKQAALEEIYQSAFQDEKASDFLERWSKMDKGIRRRVLGKI